MGVRGPPVPHLARQVLKEGKVWARAWGGPPVSGTQSPTAQPGVWGKDKGTSRRPKPQGRRKVNSVLLEFVIVWLLIRIIAQKFSLPLCLFDFSSQVMCKHTWKYNTHVSHGDPCRWPTKIQHSIKMGLSLAMKFPDSLFDSTDILKFGRSLILPLTNDSSSYNHRRACVHQFLEIACSFLFCMSLNPFSLRMTINCPLSLVYQFDDHISVELENLEYFQVGGGRGLEEKQILQNTCLMSNWQNSQHENPGS